MTTRNPPPKYMIRDLAALRRRNARLEAALRRIAEGREVRIDRDDYVETVMVDLAPCEAAAIAQEALDA